MITVRSDLCDVCGVCVAVCPACALKIVHSLEIDQERCISCMRCVKVCPVAALQDAPAPAEKERDRPIQPTQKHECDVLVVGGGPAGSLAALHAARGGRAVILLERRADVGVPVRCGEGIGKKGVSLTLTVPPEWIAATIRKISMVAPDGRVVEVRNVDESYIVDRKIMDRRLLQQAREAGANVFMSTPVASVNQSADGRYHCISGQTEFIAPCLILADGVESRLARDCGWEAFNRLKDIETCAFGRIKSALIKKDTCLFYTGSKISPGGYLWIFPRGEGAANIGLGIAGNRSGPGKARELLDTFIQEHFPGAILEDFHCGGVPVAPWRKPLVRSGAMLVGDAAGQVNCINGGGIAYALLAGKMAGTVAAQAFTGGKYNPDYLKKYQRQWARFHGRQQHRSFALKEMLLNYNDEVLNSIAGALLKENPDKLNYLRVFLRTFSRHPLLFLKAFMLFR
ncbi:MAG: geranylgeranyl reductase family protein [Chitinivibrionales bacterium]|nr:geranylgeranyl reductase family protein [Chitinivibrionales bacterium]